MENTIAFAELNEELQELHLISQEWVTDLETLEREFVQLKKQLTAAVLPVIQRDSVDKAPALLQVAAQFARNQNAFKTDLQEYVLQLDSYISNPAQRFNACFIQTYSGLQTKMAQLKNSLQKIKTQVNQLPKEGVTKTRPEQESFTQV